MGTIRKRLIYGFNIPELITKEHGIGSRHWIPATMELIVEGSQPFTDSIFG